MKKEAVGNESALLEDAIVELANGEVEAITKLEGKDNPLNWSTVARCKHQLLQESKRHGG